MSAFSERGDYAYFSLSHKRREHPLGSYIWDTCL